MLNIKSILISPLLAVLLLLPTAVLGTAIDGWNADEWRIIQSFAQDNLPPVPVDPSNRFQNDKQAQMLGNQLFFEAKLSRNNAVSCASCHQPEHLFTDQKPLAKGLGELRRHTPSLLNTAYQDWYFWDGRKDSLWSQTLTPLEDELEHGLTRIEVVRFIADNPQYRKQYESLFQPMPSTETIRKWPQKASPEGDQKALLAWKSLDKQDRETIDRIYANIGKSIAAYVATLTSRPSKLDHYIQEVKAKGHSPSLNEEEKKGLKLFISRKTACINCHSGPLLTNQGFQNIGTGVYQHDLGRSEVVDTIQWDRFNCLGAYSDAGKEDCAELVYMNKNRHLFTGSFKVPGLRNIAETAPYMHDGRFQSLQAVVTHYLSVSTENSNHLPAIFLSETEQKQLIAFLKTLSENQK